jgi:hypothetical protein
MNYGFSGLECCIQELVAVVARLYAENVPPLPHTLDM